MLKFIKMIGTEIPFAYLVDKARDLVKQAWHLPGSRLYSVFAMFF